jgi:tetratricopeptide (TPR) repeat protein
MAARFIDSLGVHSDMLQVAGHVKKATALIKDAIAIAEPFIADSNDLVEALADSFSDISLCLHMSGQYEDALAKSEKSVELGHRHTSPNHTWFASMLNMQCAPLVKAGRFADTVAAGEKAVSLCRTSTSEYLFAPVRLPLALECLSNCVAEAGDEDKALGIIQEAVNLYQDIQSKNTVPWAFVEDDHAYALVSLSARLAANGHLQDAFEHTLEAKSIYKLTITSGMLVSYLPLMTTLHLLSILFCAVGHHTEGAAAADDLVNKKCDLEVVHPELAMLVQVRLNNQNTRPSYLALRRKIPQCACDLNHLKDSCK